MKLGIIGTGKIVQEMLQIVERIGLERVYLLGTVHSQERTEKLKEQYRLDGTFYDYEKILGSDIDTVYIALPNSLHHAFAKKALEAGKHVILEKPVAVNPAELKDLIKTAQQNGCFLLEAMNIHYLPAFCEVKKDLAALGDVKIVSMNYTQYSSRYDAFKAGIVQPVFDPAKAGGALMDLNVYNVHCALALFGRPKAVRYTANMERGIDTSGILTMDYGSFQAVAIGAKDCKAPITSTIQGDKGYIRMDAPINHLRSFELCDYSGNKQEKTFGQEHRLFYEFAAFREMIEKDDHARANRMLEISLAASEIMYEARRQAGILFGEEKPE